MSLKKDERTHSCVHDVVSCHSNVGAMATDAVAVWFVVSPVQRGFQCHSS